MSRKIFVNLPVADLKKSLDFYKGLGFSINMQFTDDTAACVVISEEIYCMLLTHAKFKQYIVKDIGDAKKSTEVIVCLSCESRAEVDKLTDAALAGGGSAHMPPQDLGFMYNRSFQDPDGHVWEPMWMDPAAVQS